MLKVNLKKHNREVFDCIIWYVYPNKSVYMGLVECGRIHSDSKLKIHCALRLQKCGMVTWFQESLSSSLSTDFEELESCISKG